MSVDHTVQVAVAVIIDHRKNILICKRPAAAHMGGLWEFPGGKIESGEDVESALRREIREEMGIHVIRSRPLINIPFAYADKSVQLNLQLQVRLVSEFSGEAYGREGQEMRWITLENCHQFSFPEANRFIISALRLPELYYITPEPSADIDIYLAQLQAAIDNKATLIQFRGKHMSHDDYRRFAQASIQLCHENNVRIVLNSDANLAMELAADGVHYTSKNLGHCSKRPVPADMLFAASCHNRHELLQAQSIDADFAVIGPVFKTASHPDANTLGWDACKKLIEQVRMPVFALGGLGPTDVEIAHTKGAQGVAAIRSLWNRNDTLSSVP